MKNQRYISSLQNIDRPIYCVQNKVKGGLIMCKVNDVAEYIINYPNIYVDNLKLQKLVFYSQAVSLVINKKPLFSAVIQAWDYGPVIPELYRKYKKVEQAIPPTNKKYSLSPEEVTAIDLALSHYGNMTGSQLITLTHSEKPWRLAYARGRNTEITQQSMIDFYSTIYKYE